MKFISLSFILFFILSCSLIDKYIPGKKIDVVSVASPVAKVEVQEQQTQNDTNSLVDYCMEKMASLPGPNNQLLLKENCARVKKISSCESVNGEHIFHYEKDAISGSDATRILAFGMIHGDEPASGSVVRSWMQRLENISPRNAWRLVPILNPDGRKLKTRGNVNKVDLNRNFPSMNWGKEAINYWRRKNFEARRYPGAHAASEVETQCAIKHIEDFKPDLIVSVHAPYGILDFDGPIKLDFPKYNLIPWRRLGHFPGSLGRYMWRDHKVPVLTIELKGDSPILRLDDLDNLQDVTGILSIMATNHLEKEKSDSVKSKFSSLKKQ